MFVGSFFSSGNEQEYGCVTKEGCASILHWTIAFSVTITCYQHVLPPVWAGCHLQKSVVVVKCLSLSSGFKELLGSLVQMPFRWAKWTVMNPTSVLPPLNRHDEWSAETLWQGLHSSTRWWDVMTGLCFCIWHPQLFLYPTFFFPRC